MSSIEQPIGHFSSSDWMVLSEFLCPNYGDMTEVKLVNNSSRDVSEDDLNSYNIFPESESNKSVQISISENVNEKHFQSALGVDFPTLSEKNPSSNFASNSNQISDYSESVFTNLSVLTADVGVQTMSTALHRFPEACHSLPIPWGLNTDKPSPLTSYRYTTACITDSKSKKRKLENSTWPSNKRPAYEDQDTFKLNEILGYLKSPHLNKPNEESMVTYPKQSEYEGKLNVVIYPSGSRCIATNTQHIPMRQGPPHLRRQKVWRRTAKQYLSKEDQVSKRGPRQGSQEDKTRRMVDEIMYYYCR